jgi:hypothetical protein
LRAPVEGAREGRLIVEHPENVNPAKQFEFWGRFPRCLAPAHRGGGCISMYLWRKAHARAMADIRALFGTHAGTIIVSIMTFGIVLGLLWALRLGDMAGEEFQRGLVGVTATLLAAGLVYPLKFVSALVRLDRESSEMIAKLSDDLSRLGGREARSLQLTLRPEDHELFECQFEHPNPGALATSIISLKVVVRNTSQTRSVDEVKVVVVKKTRLLDLPARALPTRPHRYLILSGDPTVQQVSIPPQGEIAFSLCQLRETSGLLGQSGGRRAILAPASRGDTIDLEVGEHVITVKAFGRNVPPCERHYLVTITPTSIGFGEYAGLASEFFDAA